MRTVLRVEQNAGGLELWNEKPLNRCWRRLGHEMLLEMAAQSLHTAHRGETQICTFFPNDPIKSPNLLIESGRKIESQRASSGVGIWLPMKALSQTVRMVSSRQLTDMWGSRVPADLSSGYLWAIQWLFLPLLALPWISGVGNLGTTFQAEFHQWEALLGDLKV